MALIDASLFNLNNWAAVDSSLARVNTLKEPFKLGDVVNNLLTRKF